MTTPHCASSRHLSPARSARTREHNMDIASPRQLRARRRNHLRCLPIFPPKTTSLTVKIGPRLYSSHGASVYVAGQARHAAVRVSGWQTVHVYRDRKHRKYRMYPIPLAREPGPYSAPHSQALSSNRPSINFGRQIITAYRTDYMPEGSGVALVWPRRLLVSEQVHVRDAT